MQFEQAISAARLRELMDFQPESGNFHWKERQRHEFDSLRAFRAFNAKFAGKAAGSPDGKGYVQIRVDGKKYRAHRLAWLFVHGVWPSEQIDHINGDRSDNRIANLRDVPIDTNNQNERRARRNNALGCLGVYRRGGMFGASIMANGVVHRLGNFDCVEKAQSAYLDAKRRLHEGCTL